VDDWTARLAWVEHRGATTKKRSVVSATRSEAAALRRDIDEARVLIDGLCSRYLSGDAKPAPNTSRRPALGASFTWQHGEPLSRRLSLRSAREGSASR
jgi:hypothetical protein